MPRSGRRGEDGSRGHGSRRGGRERFFGQGEIRLVILHLLSERPGSGYDIMRWVEVGTSGRYVPSAGVVYPTLTLLQDLGHLVAQGSEGSRNAYAVTEAGSAYLAAYAPTLERLLEKMQDVRRDDDLVVPDEVRMALADVEAAVRSCLRRSGEGAAGRLVGLLGELTRRMADGDG